MTTCLITLEAVAGVTTDLTVLIYFADEKYTTEDISCITDNNGCSDLLPMPVSGHRLEHHVSKSITWTSLRGNHALVLCHLTRPNQIIESN